MKIAGVAGGAGDACLPADRFVSFAMTTWVKGVPRSLEQRMWCGRLCGSEHLQPQVYRESDVNAAGRSSDSRDRATARLEAEGGADVDGLAVTTIVIDPRQTFTVGLQSHARGQIEVAGERIAAPDIDRIAVRFGQRARRAR